MKLINRWRRRFLLALLARQNPGGLERQARSKIRAVVARAMQSSSAYRELCERRGVQLTKKGREQDLLSKLPVLEKSDLFEEFPLDRLLTQDAVVEELAGILTSSGHGGVKFAFGVSNRRDKSRARFDIDLGLEHAFQIDGRSTLLVNCLPMGVVFESDVVCVANVSVREDMACAILRQAGPYFEQCILVLDPLFAKRLLDYATETGLDWSALQPNVILGEESFSEDFRRYVAGAMGIPMTRQGRLRIGSSMGVGELGLNLFFETAETAAVRGALYDENSNAELPTFFCYNPLRSYVEILDPDDSGYGELVITLLDKEAPIPMIRYRTGDKVRRLCDSDIRGLTSDERAALAALPFPVIAHGGKSSERAGTEWSVDRCKALLYRNPALASAFSGAFVLREEGDKQCWEVQRRRNAQELTDSLAVDLQRMVDSVAAEYGIRAPRVTVWRYEEFKWGMSLDYERKFRYQSYGVSPVDASAVAGAAEACDKRGS